MPKSLLLISSLAAVVLTTSCATSGARDSSAADPPPEAMAGEARHAVHTAQLRRIMKDLGRRRRVSWPQEVEEEYAADERETRAQTLERSKHVASSLATASKLIPAAIADAEMSDEDRKGFAAQVDVLHKQSLDLHGLAIRGDVRGMKRLLEEIDATCKACHDRYRDVAGPLSAR